VPCGGPGRLGGGQLGSGEELLVGLSGGAGSSAREGTYRACR
jgi:hypothetical protein